LSGQHFVLRVYPEFRPEERRSESYTSTVLLVNRLSELGVKGLDPARSFPGCGSLDAMWTNVEVDKVMLERFGKGLNNVPAESRSFAAA
jgi:hypothetical protein